jgi:hypothetical protein
VDGCVVGEGTVVCGGEVGAGVGGLVVAGGGVLRRVVGVERPFGVVVVPLNVVVPGDSVVDGLLVVGPGSVVEGDDDVVDSWDAADTLMGLPLLMGSGKPAIPTPMAPQRTSRPMIGPRFAMPPSESMPQD